MTSTNKIQYVERKDIDEDRWNARIDTASNGLIYAYAFYLDAMSTNWDALVYNDYEAVMPLPWRKKWGIHYIYQPPFTAQLGVFGTNISASLFEAFLQSIPARFKYIDCPLNHQNLFPVPAYHLFQRNNFVVTLDKPYETLFHGYRENVKRNIKKANGYGCINRKDFAVTDVLEIAKEQPEKLKFHAEDFDRFQKLYNYLHGLNKSITYGIFSSKNELLASCVFTFSHNRAYYILIGNHPNGRTLGASHLLIDSFIKDHSEQNLLLDFEGSDIRNLAFFYSSFGATEEQYASLKINRLPWYAKWAKR